jgi:chromosome segregation ATPase
LQYEAPCQWKQFSDDKMASSDVEAPNFDINEVYREMIADMHQKYALVCELAADHEATILILQAENEQLRKAVADLNVENGELTNDMLDVIAENEEMQRLCNDLVDRNNALRAKNESLRTQRDDLKEGIENMLHAGEVEETIMKIKYSVKHRMKRFSVERNTLESELRKLSQEKGELLDDFQSLCDRLHQMQSTLIEKDIVIEKLKQKIESRSNKRRSTHNLCTPHIELKK